MPTVRLDAIGFGALNVDLLYLIDDFSVLQEVRPNIRRGGEYLVSEAEMTALRRLLERHGRQAGRSGGGQAGNVICALARMGFSTGFVGAVGEDDLGAFLLENLPGVDTSRVLRLGTSGHCLIAVDETKDRTSFVLPNANDALSNDLLDVGYLDIASFIHLSSFAGRAPFQAQQAVVSSLANAKISFDPGELYSRKGLASLTTILQHTHVIFATEQELKYLTGLSNSRDGAAKLMECGVAVVACKRGRLGAQVFAREETYEVGAPRVEAVDPTGAGDVFAAGFLAGLLLERPLAECAGFASEVAAHSVTGYGRERYPDAETLRRRFGTRAQAGVRSAEDTPGRSDPCSAEGEHA